MQVCQMYEGALHADVGLNDIVVNRAPPLRPSTFHFDLHGDRTHALGIRSSFLTASS